MNISLNKVCIFEILSYEKVYVVTSKYCCAHTNGSSTSTTSTTTIITPTTTTATTTSASTTPSSTTPITLTTTTKSLPIIYNLGFNIAIISAVVLLSIVLFGGLLIIKIRRKNKLKKYLDIELDHGNIVDLD